MPSAFTAFLFDWAHFLNDGYPNTKVWNVQASWVRRDWCLARKHWSAPSNTCKPTPIPKMIWQEQNQSYMNTLILRKHNCHHNNKTIAICMIGTWSTSFLPKNDPNQLEFASENANTGNRPYNEDAIVNQKNQCAHVKGTMIMGRLSLLLLCNSSGPALLSPSELLLLIKNRPFKFSTAICLHRDV